MSDNSFTRTNTDKMQAASVSYVLKMNIFTIITYFITIDLQLVMGDRENKDFHQFHIGFIGHVL